MSSELYVYLWVLPPIFLLGMVFDNVIVFLSAYLGATGQPTILYLYHVYLRFHVGHYSHLLLTRLEKVWSQQ